MKLEQTYIPDFNFCIICGKKCKNKTCSSAHKQKLERLRFAIKERKEDEKAGIKGWNTVTINKFRKLQDYLGA